MPASQKTTKKSKATAQRWAAPTPSDRQPSPAVEPNSPQPTQSQVPAADINAPIAIERVQEEEGETKIEQSNKALFVAGIVASVIITLSTVAFFFFFLQSSRKGETTTAAPVVSLPSPTPTPTFQRSAITLEVLNGSGVAGAASHAAAELRELGYTVVTIGNAEERTPRSLLRLSASAWRHEKEILADMTTFGISSASGDLTDSTLAARLIIGKR